MRSVAGLEHAPFPKVIRLSCWLKAMYFRLEHAPFPKVIRSGPATFLSFAGLEHAPFPKVIRYVRIEKPF